MLGIFCLGVTIAQGLYIPAIGNAENVDQKHLSSERNYDEVVEEVEAEALKEKSSVDGLKLKDVNDLVEKYHEQLHDLPQNNLFDETFLQMNVDQKHLSSERNYDEVVEEVEAEALKEKSSDNKLQEVKALVFIYHKKLDELIQNDLFDETFLQMNVFAASYVRFELAKEEKDVGLAHSFPKNPGELAPRVKDTAMTMNAVDAKYVVKNLNQNKPDQVGFRLWESDENAEKKFSYSADHTVFQHVAGDARGRNPRDSAVHKPGLRNRYFANDRELLYQKSMGPNIAYGNSPFWLNNIFQGTSNEKYEVSWPPAFSLMEEVISHIDEVIKWREIPASREKYWAGMKEMAARDKEREYYDKKNIADWKTPLDDFFKRAEEDDSGVLQWTICQGYEIDVGKWTRMKRLANNKEEAWKWITRALNSVPSVHLQTFLRIYDVEKFIGNVDPGVREKRLKALHVALGSFLIPALDEYFLTPDAKGETYGNKFILLNRAILDHDETPQGRIAAVINKIKKEVDEEAFAKSELVVSELFKLFDDYEKFDKFEDFDAKADAKTTRIMAIKGRMGTTKGKKTRAKRKMMFTIFKDEKYADEKKVDEKFYKNFKNEILARLAAQ